MAGLALANTKPNFIVLFVDDMGYNDIGFHNPAVVSPNIDELAGQSVRVEQYYTNQVCSPSRYSLLSGRYPYKHFISKEAGSTEPYCPPLDQKLIAERLGDAGYKTHLVGKWHLGYCSWRCTPTHRGFDTHYGFLSGGIDRYSKIAQHTDGLFDWWNNEESVRTAAGDYGEIQLTDHAVKLIEDHDSASGPMFMYVSYGNVHTPFQAPQEFQDLYPDLDENMKLYYGMVSYIDESVKNIVQALKDNGMYDNSVIVFTSDNGGLFESANTPLKGLKGQLWEGGIRVPAFIHSPYLGTPVAVKENELMHVSDFYATFLELAGATPEPGIDGINQRALFEGGSSARTEVIHGVVKQSEGGDPPHPQIAVRKGDYKFIIESLIDDRTQGWKAQLYNIIDDPSESNDLSESEPEKFKELAEMANAAWADYVAGPVLDPDYSPPADVWFDTFQPGFCPDLDEDGGGDDSKEDDDDDSECQGGGTNSGIASLPSITLAFFCVTAALTRVFA